MKAYVLAISLALLQGCGGPPPKPLTAADTEGVRIVVVAEEGDEWLYAHCGFKGLGMATNDDQARAGAKLLGANVVEPLLRSNSSSSSTVNGSTTASSSSLYFVAQFQCSDSLPSELVL